MDDKVREELNRLMLKNLEAANGMALDDAKRRDYIREFETLARAAKDFETIEADRFKADLTAKAEEAKLEFEKMSLVEESRRESERVKVSREQLAEQARQENARDKFNRDQMAETARQEDNKLTLTREQLLGQQKVDLAKSKAETAGKVTTALLGVGATIVAIVADKNGWFVSKTGMDVSRRIK